MTSITRILRRVRRSDCTTDEGKASLVEMLRKEFNAMADHITTLQLTIERMNRRCVPLEERYVEAVNAEGTTNKLTVNPVSGRITLKLGRGCRGTAAFHLIALANKVKDLEFDPMTVRGRIQWHESDKFYSCNLISDSKKMSYRLTYYTETGYTCMEKVPALRG